MSEDTDEKAKLNPKAATGLLYTDEVLANDTVKNDQLYFEDGVRRIDFILVWKVHDIDPNDDLIKRRWTFQSNLEKTGLELEDDMKVGREIQFTKVHAPFDLLLDYAEKLKICMPMKETPEEAEETVLGKMASAATSALMRPFALNSNVIPPIQKRFTCPFQKSKNYLFDIPENKNEFFSPDIRSRIVEYILNRERYTDDDKQHYEFGIKKLKADGVYLAAYPLHEGNWKPGSPPNMRCLLYENWARWSKFYKMQPLDHIKAYFGEKIGLYFAWLGFYTYCLIPASIVGFIVFIYGIATIDTNVVADEACDKNNNFTMCPLCDIRCSYWDYSQQCTSYKSSNLFDNYATVAFAVFMSLWGTFFLEFWKREEATIRWRWNLLTSGSKDEEEIPRVEYIARVSRSKYTKIEPITKEEIHYFPFWRRQVPVMLCSYVIMIFLVFVALAVVIGIILYRMAVLFALYQLQEKFIYNNASLFTTITASIINLIFIFILNFIYARLANKLTEWECPRTESEFEARLTFKLYILQFVNYYSSLFYIAFFKGRFAGRPGDYNTFFGARQEECAGGSCFMELCLQLAIVFVGKILIQNNLMEVFLPRAMKYIKKRFYRDSKEDKSKVKPWEKDFVYDELGQNGVFNEHLEIAIQFGFVTLFVAAFPLAPLCALLNNIIEIRADADKFVTLIRRPVADKDSSLGIWYYVIFCVSRIAVLTNAFIIAFTTSFVERLVYMLEYSPDGSLRGYVNFTLAYFNVSDLAEGTEPAELKPPYNAVEICRYRDFREPPWSPNKYEYTIQFWHVLAAEFIFIVLFENLVVLSTILLAFLIPDMPKKVREHVAQEQVIISETILRTEVNRRKGFDGLQDGDMQQIRRRMAMATARQKSTVVDGPSNEYQLTSSPNFTIQNETSQNDSMETAVTDQSLIMSS